MDIENITILAAFLGGLVMGFSATIVIGVVVSPCRRKKQPEKLGERRKGDPAMSELATVYDPDAPSLDYTFGHWHSTRYFKPRVEQALKNYTIADVVSASSREDLLKRKGIGPVSVDEFISTLNHYGYRLQDQ